jgi:lipoyl(octanoyl) transferase
MMNQKQALCALILLLACTSLTNGFVAPTKRNTSRRRRRTGLQIAPQQLGTFEELTLTTPREERRVALHDWSMGNPIPFTEAWDFQKTLVDAHLERLSSTTECSQFVASSQSQQVGVDSVLFLQHDPVYTLGTASDPGFIVDDGSNKVKIVRMDRGGEVTYHGPGQLVVYPILDLRGYSQDIHWYMRALEECVLRAIQSAGIQQSRATRQVDVTGVWLDNTKVAAVGIKARRWITMHGLAVNVENESLQNFDGIVPCGLEGRKVGCLNQHLDKPLTVAEFAMHMKEAIEQVFQIHLVASGDADK